MKMCPVLFLSALMVQAAHAGSKYIEVSYRALEVSPEEYKNKKVLYSATFINFSTTFQPYMERSGFGPKKHLWLIIGDYSIPAIAKKTEAMTQFVAELKKGSKVKVYGKVKKFKTKPKRTIRAYYYVEVENLELVPFEEPAPDTSLPRKPRRRHFK